MFIDVADETIGYFVIRLFDLDGKIAEFNPGCHDASSFASFLEPWLSESLSLRLSLHDFSGYPRF
jgi:hypothetical protein